MLLGDWFGQSWSLTQRLTLKRRGDIAFCASKMNNNWVTMIDNNEVHPINLLSFLRQGRYRCALYAHTSSEKSPDYIDTCIFPMYLKPSLPSGKIVARDLEAQTKCWLLLGNVVCLLYRHQTVGPNGVSWDQAARTNRLVRDWYRQPNS